MISEREEPRHAQRRSDFERALMILRRRAVLIGLCFVIGAAAAFGLSALQTKQYSASASLLFGNPDYAEELFGTGNNSSIKSDPTRDAATNRWLVGLKVVGERTAAKLPGLTPAEVSDMVSVSPSAGQADAVDVTATSSSSREAQVVANTFARQFIEFRAETNRSKLIEAKRLAEESFNRLSPKQQAGPRGKELSTGAEKLGILASLQTGDAELVQTAGLPTAPSSPKPVRNAILGGMLGLLLGIALAVLLERLNRRMRDPEEIRDAFGLPVIGAIPESRAIMASSNDTADVAPDLPFVENEAFRMLRASLRYFSVDRDLRSVLITSDSAGAGKSTVSWNLARVAASSANAVVVEVDLRNPTLSRQHGLAPAPGLAEILTRQATLDEAIQTKPLPSSTNGRGIGHHSFDVIVAGALPPNPAELIESEAMKEVLAQLTERYELVVIDTAPVGVVADAYPLLNEVDGVMIVARIDKTTRDAAEALREQLTRLNAPLLGVVANAVKKTGSRYYGYYGAVESKPEPQTESVSRA